MEDTTTKIVQDFLKHLTERNLKELMELFPETVDWYIPGDQHKAPWLGKRNNREEIFEVFELLWKSTEPVSAQIDNIFIEKENVVIAGEFSIKMVKTKNIVDSLFFIQMQIQDDQIKRYRLLEDSFAVSKSLTA